MEIKKYRTAAGRAPFLDWLADAGKYVAGRIMTHVGRMRSGNFGDSRSVGNGVIELKMNFGPGYRLYYLHDGDDLVVLLCGGDKGSQADDIRRAHAHASDYWRRR